MVVQNQKDNQIDRGHHRQQIIRNIGSLLECFGDFVRFFFVIKKLLVTSCLCCVVLCVVRHTESRLEYFGDTHAYQNEARRQWLRAIHACTDDPDRALGEGVYLEREVVQLLQFFEVRVRV